MKRLIQIKTKGLDWENTPKHYQDFKTWEELVTFCYRLSLLYETEIRSENNGNGYYFSHCNAERYLNNI